MPGAPGAPGPLSATMTSRRLFVILAALYSALAVWFVPRMDASGDEPHYLVMAQSLWRENDLDLQDNYAREDWREFRNGPTEPHYAAPRKDGRPFPGHSPGLPFVLAPVYASGGRLACAILLGLMVAAVGAIAHGIALAEGLSASAALLAGLVAAGPPLSAYGLHIYTEAPSALALFAAYALSRFGTGLWASGLAAALACALPFLHPKMALASIAIAFAAFVLQDRGSFRAFALVALIGALGYSLFWMSIFGSFTVLGMYGGAPQDVSANPGQAFIGILMDRAYGLLPIAPAFLALFLLKTPRAAGTGDLRPGRVEVALFLAVLVPALFWRMWWGGQSPPARLIAPVTPFLALWLARMWEGARQLMVRRAIIVAVAGSWALFLFAALQPARLLFINRRVRPTRLWDALWPGGPIDALLPDMARPVASDWVLAATWLLGIMAIAAICRKAQSRSA